MVLHEDQSHPNTFQLLDFLCGIQESDYDKTDLRSNHDFPFFIIATFINVGRVISGTFFPRLEFDLNHFLI